MVCPTLISAADVPGPYFACADAALAVSAVLRPMRATAPRLLQSCMSFPPVVFLISFYGHPRLAHDGLVALAFRYDEICELDRCAADRNTVLLRDHRPRLRCLHGAHRLLAHLLEQVGRHALRPDHAVPRQRLVTPHPRFRDRRHVGI